MFLHVILIHIMTPSQKPWMKRDDEKHELWKYQIEMVDDVVPICFIRSEGEINVFSSEVGLFWLERVGKHCLGVSSVLKDNEYSL